jgi:hypothetical protein
LDKEHGILPDIVSINLILHPVEGLNKYINDKRPIPIYKYKEEEHFSKWKESKEVAGESKDRS